MRFACVTVIFSLVLGCGVAAGTTNQVCADGPSPTLGDLQWFAGRWIEEKDGTVTEEHWMSPRGKRMVGMNRTTLANEKGMFEFLRIEQRPTGLVYVAQPNGNPPTEFRFVELKERRVVFANPAVDFPQRIVYESPGPGKLYARIEGEVNGQARSMEWHWRSAE